MKVAVLGINGMLGSQMFQTCQNAGLQTIGLARPTFDAEQPDFSLISECDYAINCIGIIKPYISKNSNDIIRAIKVNALFPHELAKINIKIIQIATDCVWDGRHGYYTERDLHNATDIYGKTKSLGEVNADNFLNLRCSIIGREKKSYLSLLEYFLNQPKNSHLKGFKNHLWNGLTTEAFSKICVGIIKNNCWFSGLAHIIPADILSKSQMLHLFAKHFNRNDITISDINTEIGINRTLSTNNPTRNSELWRLGGYSEIPTIENMIEELSYS